MATNTYTQKYADGTTQTLRRKKQGRKPSADPMEAITVRIPASWLAEMQDPRHEIRVALYNYRTRNLVKQ